MRKLTNDFSRKPRKKFATKARKAYEIILNQPGITYLELSRAIGIRYNSLIGYLATCETHGWLVFEGEGRLWPFECAKCECLEYDKCKRLEFAQCKRFGCSIETEGSIA